MPIERVVNVLRTQEALTQKRHLVIVLTHVYVHGLLTLVYGNAHTNHWWSIKRVFLKTMFGQKWARSRLYLIPTIWRLSRFYLSDLLRTCEPIIFSAVSISTLLTSNSVTQLSMYQVYWTWQLMRSPATICHSSPLLPLRRSSHQSHLRWWRCSPTSSRIGDPLAG